MAERHRLLLESPNLQEEKIPRRSAESSTESGYVLSITSLPSFYAASASAPFNVIDIFDKKTLQGIQTLSGHEKATTSLRTAVNLGGVVQNCLLSSGKDGSVKAWDERSNTHSIKSKCSKYQPHLFYHLTAHERCLITSDECWKPTAFTMLRCFAGWVNSRCWK